MYAIGANNDICLEFSPIGEYDFASKRILSSFSKTGCMSEPIDVLLNLHYSLGEFLVSCLQNLLLRSYVVLRGDQHDVPSTTHRLSRGAP